MRRFGPPLLLSSLLLAGCNDDQGIVRLEVSGEFQPPTLAYGEVPIGLSRSLTVELVNTSAAPFTVDEISAGGAFSVRAVEGFLEDKLINGGERVEVEVSFISIAENFWDENIMIKAGDLEIPLRVQARGVFRMVPEFTVEPAVLDFGVVEIGTTTRLPFAVNNVGNASGSLTGAGLRSAATDFTIDAPWPLIVTEGIRGVFFVNFAPTRPGGFDDVMVVSTAEGPTVEIQVKGEARGGDGQFFCTPSAVAFDVVPRGQVQSTTLTCTARGGSVTITGSELALDAQYFAITNQPGMATVPPDGTVQYTVEFRPDGLPLAHDASLWIHYSGSTGPATLAIPISGEVGVPPPAANAISAVLTWTTDFTDVDLHLVRPGGAPFSLESDCFWAANAPDWGVPSVQSDNPFLDVDDIDGFGPETVNMREAAPGDYTLYGHYYADRQLGPTDLTMEIYVAGNLVATHFQPGVRCNDLWNVGTISWNGTSGTFTPNLNVSPTQSGNCQ